MEALVERGVRLDVLEMDERMVPRMMDRAGGELIKLIALSESPLMVSNE